MELALARQLLRNLTSSHLAVGRTLATSSNSLRNKRKTKARTER
jgi:hypothetical protein